MAKKRPPKIVAEPTQHEIDHPELLAKSRREQLAKQAATARMEVEQMNDLEIKPQPGIENVIEITETGPGFEGGVSVVAPMVSEGAVSDVDELTSELLSDETAARVIKDRPTSSVSRVGRPEGYKKNKETGEWEYTKPREEVFSQPRRITRVQKEPKAESSNTGVAKRVSQRGQKLLVKSTAIVAGLTDPPIAMTQQEAYDIVDPFASWLARQPIIENPVLRKIIDNFELGEVGLGIADYASRVIREEMELVQIRRAEQSAREEYIRASQSRTPTVAESLQPNNRIRGERQGTEEQRSSPITENPSSSNGIDRTTGNVTGEAIGFTPKIPQPPGV
jgi:hypothetical protein